MRQEVSRLWLGAMYWLASTTGISEYRELPPFDVIPVTMHKIVCVVAFLAFSGAALTQLARWSWAACRGE